jgi:hypothetical protein
LFDGFSSAREATKVKGLNDVLKLNVGDTMDPFTLIEFDRPIKYWFSLNSLFFSCQTGYVLSSNDNGTKLALDLIAGKPTYKYKIWWFLFKHVHGVLANKALRVSIDICTRSHAPRESANCSHSGAGGYHAERRN